MPTVCVYSLQISVVICWFATIEGAWKSVAANSNRNSIIPEIDSEWKLLFQMNRNLLFLSCWKENFNIKLNFCLFCLFVVFYIFVTIATFVVCSRLYILQDDFLVVRVKVEIRKRILKKELLKLVLKSIDNGFLDLFVY